MVDVMVPGVNRLLVLKENLRVQTVLFLCPAVFDFLSHVKLMSFILLSRVLCLAYLQRLLRSLLNSWF